MRSTWHLIVTSIYLQKFYIETEISYRAEKKFTEALNINRSSKNISVQMPKTAVSAGHSPLVSRVFSGKTGWRCFTSVTGDSLRLSCFVMPGVPVISWNSLIAWRRLSSPQPDGDREGEGWRLISSRETKRQCWEEASGPEEGAGGKTESSDHSLCRDSPILSGIMIIVQALDCFQNQESAFSKKSY